MQAAVDSLTKNFALEWGTDYGIRCNCIAPGPIAGTPGMDKLNPEEAKVSAQKIIPLGRMGEKWEIAMAAIYLSCNAGNLAAVNNSFQMMVNMQGF
jgi:peroxisomal 2,4-dienoyl-CoA reductase